MKKKSLKIILIIVLAACSFNYNMHNTYAMSRHIIRTTCVLPGSNNNDYVGEGCAVGRHVYCNVKQSKETEEMMLKEDLYDTNGNFLGSASMLQNKIALISGKFIGIDAYEEYKKTFYVTVNPECLYGEYVTKNITIYKECTHTSVYWYTDSRGFDHRAEFSYVTQCPETKTVTVLECRPCEVEASECRDEADRKLNQLAHSVNVEPSYTGYRQDVNDINKGVQNGEPTIAVNESSKYVDYGTSQPANRNSSTIWQTVTMKYRYNLRPAYIDPQTGKVKYENEMTNDEKNTYTKIPEIYVNDNGTKVQIGQYFVPLNTKSTDLLKYNLLPKLSRPALSEELCISLIDNYPTKTDDGIFWGDFLARKADGGSIYKLTRTAEGAKQTVRRENGCRLALYLTFSVKQGFYKEVQGKNGTGTTIIEGYNFYYRPIDYTEPFPNGMDSNGFWYSRYDRKNNATKVTNSKGQVDKLNSQDLDESFSKVTYITNNDYSAERIRNYNADVNHNGIYNSWIKMNTNGTSKFISGNYGVSRNGCQSFYALGCGPANANWEQCKKITEVCG